MKKITLLAAVGLYFVALGCGEPGCPDKHVRLDGQCVPYGSTAPSNTGGSNGGSGAGATAGSTSDAGNHSSSGGANSAHEAAFDAPCTSHSDCGGDTDYCGMPPGAPAYCTASGCDVTPSKCPEGWTCTDLGQFLPGEPSICVKPAVVGNGAFGDGCAMNTDCSGETNYCAISPTEPPYCTVSGCDARAELCPEGWSCFDVGQFVPGEPFICLKPPATQ